jgi:hypothetical protein
MSKKTKKTKNAVRATHTNERAADAANPATAAVADELPTTSPIRFMALLFGVPLAVLIAAIAFRLLTGN